jgi:hypothetical protein
VLGDAVALIGALLLAGDLDVDGFWHPHDSVAVQKVSVLGGAVSACDLRRVSVVIE